MKNWKILGIILAAIVIALSANLVMAETAQQEAAREGAYELMTDMHSEEYEVYSWYCYALDYRWACLDSYPYWFPNNRNMYDFYTDGFQNLEMDLYGFEAGDYDYPSWSQCSSVSTTASAYVNILRDLDSQYIDYETNKDTTTVQQWFDLQDDLSSAIQTLQSAYADLEGGTVNPIWWSSFYEFYGLYQDLYYDSY